MASNGCEELMQAWFSKSAHDERKSLAEKDIRGIAEVLERTANGPWSRIPRIYSVLRIINQLQAIDCFLAEDISDVWFPFSARSLPLSLRDQTARSAFLAAQQLVFNTRAQDLEREQRYHTYFHSSADVPVKKLGELGKGGYGLVDRVVSTISHKQYARKLIPRGKNFKKDKAILKAFERELSSLKKSGRHKHIVQLVGSYTEPKYVGILTSPVADCNLHEYLTQHLDVGKKSFLRGFFGCLTSALQFLHSNAIRHKDIKPQNVLVKNEHVFLTDFGLSLDWSESNNSMTSGPTLSTPRYGAPEVAERTTRNSSADIWSLGCVFLEMWTVLKAESKQSLERHLESTGTCSSSYCLNPVGVSSWIGLIRALPGSTTDDAPAAWITNMLRHERSMRWSALELEEAIRTHNDDQDTSFAFTGTCCLHEDYTSESVHSSSDEDNVDNADQTSADSAIDQKHGEQISVPEPALMTTSPMLHPLAEDYTQSKASYAVQELHSQSSHSDSEEPIGQEQLVDFMKSATIHESQRNRDVTHHLEKVQTLNSVLEQMKTVRPPQPYVEEEEVSLAREVTSTQSAHDNIHGPHPDILNKETAANEAAEGEASSIQKEDEYVSAAEGWGFARSVSSSKKKKKRKKEKENEKKAVAGEKYTSAVEPDVDGSGDCQGRVSQDSAVCTADPTERPKTARFDVPVPYSAPFSADEHYERRWVFFASGSKSPYECKTCAIRRGQITLKCRHNICEKCLKSKIILSTQKPQHMPPKCCGIDIVFTAERLAYCLGRELSDTWNRKYRESNSAAIKFCEPKEENVLFCPNSTCKEWIIPSKIRVDYATAKKYVRCAGCQAPVCLTCGKRFHGAQTCQKLQSRPPRWEMCWQICLRCKIPWNVCYCNRFEEGFHDTRNDYDVRSIKSEERQLESTSTPETMDASKDPPFPHVPPSDYAAPYYDYQPHTEDLYATRQNPAADPTYPPHPPLYPIYHRPASPPPPPLYHDTYYKDPLLPNPFAAPPPHRTERRYKKRGEPTLNRHAPPEPQRERKTERASPDGIEDSHQSDLSSDNRPPFRRKTGHRQARKTVRAQPKRKEDSNVSAVAVVHYGKESDLAGLSYRDPLKSPERILEWLIHVRVDHDATQTADLLTEVDDWWMTVESDDEYEQAAGYDDFSDTYIDFDRE